MEIFSTHRNTKGIIKILLVSFSVIGAFLFSFTPASSRTWYISPDGGGDAPTIQAGIDSAAADTVLLASGTYTGVGNREINYNGKAVTVRSQSGDPSECIIDCEAGSPVFRRAFCFVSAETLTSVLEGVTITNCDEGDGGAISCLSSSPYIKHCVFLDNAATYGGAMYIGDGAPRLEDCVFSGGVADADGAITLSGASPVLIRCTFVNNIGAHDSAGAMYVYRYSSATFEDCLFVGNSTPFFWGGAVAVASNSYASFAQCLFSGNSAAEGGALTVDGSSAVTITSCTFHGNEAAAGAAISGSGTASIVRTIISFSNAGGQWPATGHRRILRSAAAICTETREGIIVRASPVNRV